MLSFYNGIRIAHEVVDSRDWKLNDNTISVGDAVIDVPKQYANTQRYCATLGHKANHCFDNNAVYDWFDHPRFGFIKCIRAITTIQAHEEICVLYGYSLSKDGTLDAPEWYKDLLLRSLKN